MGVLRPLYVTVVRAYDSYHLIISVHFIVSGLQYFYQISFSVKRDHQDIPVKCREIDLGSSMIDQFTTEFRGETLEGNLRRHWRPVAVLSFRRLTQS